MKTLILWYGISKNEIPTTENRRKLSPKAIFLLFIVYSLLFIDTGAADMFTPGDAGMTNIPMVSQSSLTTGFSAFSIQQGTGDTNWGYNNNKRFNQPLGSFPEVSSQAGAVGNSNLDLIAPASSAAAGVGLTKQEYNWDATPVQSSAASGVGLTQQEYNWDVTPVQSSAAAGVNLTQDYNLPSAPSSSNLVSQPQLPQTRGATAEVHISSDFPRLPSTREISSPPQPNESKEGSGRSHFEERDYQHSPEELSTKGSEGTAKVTAKPRLWKQEDFNLPFTVEHLSDVFSAVFSVEFKDEGEENKSEH